MALFAAACFVATQIDYQDISDRITSSQFEPSAEVADLSGNLELTDKGKRILYASSPVVAEGKEFNTNCAGGGDEHVNVLGCYYAKKIFVFAVKNDQVAGIKEVTLAHELLHAVWARLGEREHTKLGALLRQVYEKNAYLNDKMQYYAPSEFENELHSIVGTEVRDLPEELELHYAKYFKNRAAIVTTFEGYNEVFNQLMAQSEELSAKMAVLEKDITALKTDYEGRRDTLNAEITDFNRRADNHAFASNSDFYSERAILERDINDLNGLYEEINQKISEYNNLVEQYNAISVHLTELANSISSATPPVEF